MGCRLPRATGCHLLASAKRNCQTYRGASPHPLGRSPQSGPKTRFRLMERPPSARPHDAREGLAICVKRQRPALQSRKVRVMAGIWVCRPIRGDRAIDRCSSAAEANRALCWGRCGAPIDRESPAQATPCDLSFAVDRNGARESLTVARKPRLTALVARVLGAIARSERPSTYTALPQT
jgi:hypothetical protein